MQIRPFGLADEATVVALWEACGLTRPWNDPRRDIARKLAVQPELFLVVRASNPDAVAFYRRLGYAQDESVSLGKRLIVDV